MPRNFPGAKVEEPPKGHKGFACADGTRIPHKGLVTTPARMCEGQRRTITWKNTDVDFPILSTHELSRNGSRLAYDEDEGFIIDKTNGAQNKFIQTASTYVCKMVSPGIFATLTLPNRVFRGRDDLHVTAAA